MKNWVKVDAVSENMKAQEKEKVLTRCQPEGLPAPNRSKKGARPNWV